MKSTEVNSIQLQLYTYLLYVEYVSSQFVEENLANPQLKTKKIFFTNKIVNIFVK